MEWQPIETAPVDGRWFVAMPRPEHGFSNVPYPPTVTRVTGRNYDWDAEKEGGFAVECKAMNSGSTTWELADFTHWLPLPELPQR